ncbi:MAG TPA: hypothetical protein VGK48_09260 [Terriglobia bacterium]|jgi:hypothetical protein
MFNRVMLFASISILLLCLAGCGGGEDEKQAPAATPAPAPKPAEEKVPVYELTKDDITSHEGWTSRNISVLGVKIGDKTAQVEKNLGAVDNTRTLPKTDTDPSGHYLTIYQDMSVFAYTVPLTGKLDKIEVYQGFAKKIADEKLKTLLTNWSLKSMHAALGMEEGPAVENADDNSTAYPYDSRGFQFVRFKVKGTMVNAIRFTEVKKSS